MSKKNEAGRPSKYCSGVVERLCDALSDGMPIKGACVVAGIGVTTLAEWRDTYPALEGQMSEARERARQNALQKIKAAGEKDWRAHAEWLRLTFASDYRGPAKIEVKASAHAAAGVLVSVAEQLEIQKRRAEALSIPNSTA